VSFQADKADLGQSRHTAAPVCITGLVDRIFYTMLITFTESFSLRQRLHEALHSSLHAEPSDPVGVRLIRISQGLHLPR
jgi:hypothetical protein